MPTYRYRCGKCGEDFEVWQSISDPALTRHNGGCRGKLTKVLSPAGIVLKGSGFYKTDNRSGSTSNGHKTESGTGSNGSSDAKEPSATAKKDTAAATT